MFQGLFRRKLRSVWKLAPLIISALLASDAFAQVPKVGASNDGVKADAVGAGATIAVAAAVGKIAAGFISHGAAAAGVAAAAATAGSGNQPIFQTPTITATTSTR